MKSIQENINFSQVLSKEEKINVPKEIIGHIMNCIKEIECKFMTNELQSMRRKQK